MIQSESRKILLSIICIAFLIIAFFGISYAAFNTVFHNSDINGISTGTISLILEGDTDSLLMENVMPISDDEGMKLDHNNIYDFTIRSSLSAHTTLNYEIYAEKIDSGKQMLSDTSVRFYLQRLNGETYENTSITQIPQPFIPLQEDSFLGSKKGSMILYSGTLVNPSKENSEVKDHFRLRMWVSKDTIIDSVSRDFNIKLSVSAKAM